MTKKQKRIVPILQTARIYSGVPGKVPGWRSAVGLYCRFNRCAVYILLLGIMCILLSSCAVQEPQETVAGIDGYVYRPRRLTTSPEGGYEIPEMFEDLNISGDFLYYCCREGNARSVKRTVLPGDSGMVDLSGAETVFSLVDSSLPIESEGAGTEGEILEQLDMAREAASPETELEDSILIGSGKNYAYFSLGDYAVDEGQNVYLVLGYSMGEGFEMESQGSLVCKMSAEGEWLYRRYYPGMQYKYALSADGAGGLYLLTGEGVCAIDRDGNKNGISGSSQEITAEYGRFFSDQEGQVCLLWDEGTNIPNCKAVEFLQEDKIRLRDLGSLPQWEGAAIYTSGYFLLGGKIIYNSHGGDLSAYDLRTSEIEPILYWTESQLIESYVSAMILLEPDTFLVWYEEPGEEGLYLLEKTPVSELPAKTRIVIADLESSEDLRNTVIRFNRWNEKYDVTIEDYGYAGGEAEGAAIRRDAALVSSDPPQLLDLGGRELDRDMEKGLLEDLSPYLERSAALNREDFLENVLEGYTIDGRLAGIPVYILAKMTSGRPSQLEDVSSWAMEDVYALTEQYPDCRLLGNGSSYEMNTWENLLESFCADYYMEEFVDWEKGECRFDSEGFQKLLLWVGEHGKEKTEPRSGEIVYSLGQLPEDTLLYERWISFDSAAELPYRFAGLESLSLPRLLGYPTADGRGTIHLYAGSTLGIVAGAENKDGAWEFLEFYLLQEEYGPDNRRLSTRKSVLQEMMEDAVTEQYSDDGHAIRQAKHHLIIDGQMTDLYATPRELAEELMAYIQEADFRYRSDRRDRIIDIVTEEAESYYQGNRSLEETLGVIQNRVQLILQE